MESKVGGYEVRFVDLPFCRYRFGRFIVKDKKAEPIMTCGAREYIKVEFQDCIECALNC